MSVKLKVTLLGLLVLCLCAIPASADTFNATDHGINFSGTVTDTSVSLTVSNVGCTFSDCDFLGGVSFQGWNGFPTGPDFTVVSGGASAAYDSPEQGKVSGPNNCGTDGAASVCWPASGDNAIDITSGPWTFTAVVSGAQVASSFSVQAAFYKATEISGPNQVGQISFSFGPGGNPPPPVPEPASLALIGSGLAVVGRKIRNLRS